jgi:ribosomal protein S18 acetylase RimI-like enzyme
MAEGEASNRPLTIHVEVYNPAMRLYERLGFRPIEERGPYLLMEWRPSQLNTAS